MTNKEIELLEIECKLIKLLPQLSVEQLWTLHSNITYELIKRAKKGELNGNRNGDS